MHNIIDSELDPISLRAGSIATIAATCVVALGFASVPQLWYFLTAGLVISVIILATGPKCTNVSVERPTALMALLPTLLAVVFRGTSLVWVVVPVLAFVVAAATWMLVTNRYAETTVEESAEPVVEQAVPHDELAPKREEKTAVTNDETSATAA